MKYLTGEKIIFCYLQKEYISLSKDSLLLRDIPADQGTADTVVHTLSHPRYPAMVQLLVVDSVKQLVSISISKYCTVYPTGKNRRQIKNCIYSPEDINSKDLSKTYHSCLFIMI